MANNLIGNNVKINDTKDTITKAEYDSLIHNSEVLEALKRVEIIGSGRNQLANILERRRIFE